MPRDPQSSPSSSNSWHVRQAERQGPRFPPVKSNKPTVSANDLVKAREKRDEAARLERASYATALKDIEECVPNMLWLCVKKRAEAHTRASLAGLTLAAGLHRAKLTKPADTVALHNVYRLPNDQVTLLAFKTALPDNLVLLTARDASRVMTGIVEAWRNSKYCAPEHLDRLQVRADTYDRHPPDVKVKTVEILEFTYEILLSA